MSKSRCLRWFVMGLALLPACGGGGSNGPAFPPWFALHSATSFQSVPLLNPGFAQILAMAVLDANGDREMDVVGVVSPNEGSAYLLPHALALFGDGTGAFRWISPNRSFAFPFSPFDHRGVAVGDFNGDRVTDLAVTDALDFGARAIVLEEPDENPNWIPQAPTSVGAVPSRIVTGRWDRDAYLDLAILVPAARTVRVLFGKGDGTFELRVLPMEIPLGTGPDPRDLVAGDFDDDGELDLATANHGDDTVSVFLGRGDGGFEPQTPVAVAGGPDHLAVARLDAGATLDLAVTCSTSHHVAILLGDGTGGFSVATRVAVDLLAGPEDIVGADFDGDGSPDLAFTFPTKRQFGLLRNRGDGTFSTPPISRYDTKNTPRQIEAVEVTKDGAVDLLVLTRAILNVFITDDVVQTWRNVAP